MVKRAAAAVFTVAMLTSCGGGGASKPGSASRTQNVTARDFTFDGMSGLAIRKGDKVDFQMTNAGPSKHELEIVAPDGKVLGYVAPIDPSQSGSTTVTFNQAGTYTY